MITVGESRKEIGIWNINNKIQYSFKYMSVFLYIKH